MCNEFNHPNDNVEKIIDSHIVQNYKNVIEINRKR